MIKIDNKAIGKRIIELQNKHGINSRKFALSIDMDASQLGKIEKGKLGLSPSAAVSISKKYDVDINWLFEGEGNNGRWNKVAHETINNNGSIRNPTTSINSEPVGLNFIPIED